MKTYRQQNQELRATIRDLYNRLDVAIQKQEKYNPVDFNILTKKLETARDALGAIREMAVQDDLKNLPDGVGSIYRAIAEEALEQTKV